MKINTQITKTLNLMENHYFFVPKFNKLKDTKSALEVDFVATIKGSLFSLMQWIPVALYSPIWVLIKNTNLPLEDIHDELLKENELDISFGSVFDINYNLDKETLFKAYTCWDYKSISEGKDKIILILLEIKKFNEIKWYLKD